MATVTLTGPRRLNIGGELYKRGEPVEMEDHLAMQFEEDERFKVRGVRISPDERRERVAAKEARPMGDSLMRAINEAIADLDVDDDDAFDRHGKPSIRSISAILGYQITAQERDRAMGQAMGKSGQLETLSRRRRDDLRAARARQRQAPSVSRAGKPSPRRRRRSTAPSRTATRRP